MWSVSKNNNIVSFGTMLSLVRILRYTPLVKERFSVSRSLSIMVILVVTSSAMILTDQRNTFPYDVLTPYPKGRHGSTRHTRDVSSCQHFVWENHTYEVLEIPPVSKWTNHAHYETFQFADVVHQGPLRRRYAVGSISFIDDPYHTFTLLEPKKKEGCKMRYFSAEKSTVQETIRQRKNGCHLAANAGYFDVHNGECLGNVISSGHVIKSTDGVANANFGIRSDGTIVVGYLSEADIRNQSNPFRQLVSGVIWLVRNGTNYVNESMRVECGENENTGSMKTFVEVLSSRSAIGHDANGRLVMAHVEGQTHVRGANLYEFADLLIRKGVVNAINLDGGGSTTFVQEGYLTNYPSDHCFFDAKYRCPREVSTVICIHDPDCLDPDCSGHGSCDQGVCMCEQPWTGEMCNILNCSLVNCSGSGSCSDGKCHCDPGKTGDFCEKGCDNNHFGPDCAHSCFCYGRSICHPIYGNCTCPAGLTGYGCWHECASGWYGPNCQNMCDYPDCSGHGLCSKVTGKCLCEEDWIGESCNDTEVQPNDTPTNTSIIAPTNMPTPTTAVDLLSSRYSISNDILTTPPSYISSRFDSVNESTIAMVTPDTMVTMTTSPTVITHSNITCNTSQVQNSVSKQSFTAIALLVSMVTIMVHIVICLLRVHCRGLVLGVAQTRAEMRREIMEQRQCEEFLRMGNNWNSDSD